MRRYITYQITLPAKQARHVQHLQRPSLAVIRHDLAIISLLQSFGTVVGVWIRFSFLKTADVRR